MRSVAGWGVPGGRRPDHHATVSVEPPPTVEPRPLPPYAGNPPPPVEGAVVRPGPPLSRLWWVTGPLLAVLVVAVTVLGSLPVPYLVQAPGSDPLLRVSARDGGPDVVSEPADSDLLFVTVSVRRPFGFEALYRLRDDTTVVVPEDVLLGTQSREQNRAFNAALMVDSQQRAAKVALEVVGYEVPVSTTGAVITDLGPEFPAARFLRPGDTVVAADGQPVASADELVDAIAGRRPGDVIRLEVERVGGGAVEEVEVELVPHTEDAARPQLGVSIQDRPSYEFPVDIEIDTGRVSGPSAGLAFTLAIVDRLTEGDLTGDRKVAVTGTIQLDGSVGLVGGVAQKAEAAVRAGADLFLVPPGEGPEAEDAARGRAGGAGRRARPPGTSLTWEGSPGVVEVPGRREPRS